MKRLLTTASVCVATIATVSFIAPVLLAQEAGQAAKTGQAREATLDSSITARVDKLFEKWVKPDSPGCAVAVMREGQIVYSRAAGLANLEYGTPLTTTSRFKVGSMSKQFTAAAIVLLTQEGRLSLDDDVRKHLPEVPDFGATITLRLLLHHTSGLRTNLETFPGRPFPVTEDHILQLVSRQRDLNAPPGAAYAYSNTSYELLAMVAKRVSSQSLREFTRARIFEPLGMASTFFSDDHAEVIPNHAQRYRPAKNGWRTAVEEWDVMGATGLVTTAEDMARWAANLDQPRVGGPKLVEQLKERARLNGGEPADYGYSFGSFLSKHRGLRTMEVLGPGAYMMWLPERSFAVVTLCNGNPNAYVLPPKIADVYLEGQFPEPPPDEPKPVDLPQAELAALTGLYWNEHDDVFLRMEVKNSRVHLVQANGSQELLSVGAGLFQAPGPMPLRLVVRFAPAQAGQPRLFTNMFPGETPMVFTAVEGVRPAPSDLQEYVGTYFSQEFDLVWRIELDGDRLQLKRLRFPPAPLLPATHDAFVITPNRTIRFVREPGNKVSGLRTSGFPPGLQRIRFEKVELFKVSKEP